MPNLKRIFAVFKNNNKLTFDNTTHKYEADYSFAFSCNCILTS
jgi:hypothetical protein